MPIFGHAEIKNDGPHGKNTRVVINGVDLSHSCEAVEVFCSVKDVNRVVLHMIAGSLDVGLYDAEIVEAGPA